MDGETLYASSRDNTIKKINYIKEVLIQEFKEHGDVVRRIRLNENEKYLYSASHDKSLIRWSKDEKENSNYKIDQKITFNSEINSLSLHNESK